jgi:DNA-binding transcriptional LysR family regulator
MDKLKAIQTFIAIAEHGSLTAASLRLDVSLPTVVRTLAELERHLGVTLFTRTTRRINLTQEGRRYLETCRLALTQLNEAEQALSATRSKPSGKLTVTSSVLFGRMHVAPLVLAFLKRWPDVSAELVLLDRVVDLVEEGVDVGVRIGPLPDSSLHGVNVGNVRRVLCASPAYIKRHASINHPDDLAGHTIIHFNGLGSAKEMQFVDATGSHRITIEPRWVSNSVDAALDAVASGLGAGQFLSYMVEPLLRDGRLQLLLEAYAPPAVPVTVVYPHSRLLSTKVRLFVDLAASQLRAALI